MTTRNPIVIRDRISSSARRVFAADYPDEIGEADGQPRSEEIED
jgi:hypothetical protein